MSDKPHNPPAKMWNVTFAAGYYPEGRTHDEAADRYIAINARHYPLYRIVEVVKQINELDGSTSYLVTMALKDGEQA